MHRQVRSCRTEQVRQCGPPSDSRFSSTEDLWDCLEQASGKPIAAVMGSWTKQMGFPIIVVDQEQVCVLCSDGAASQEHLAGPLDLTNTAILDFYTWKQNLEHQQVLRDLASP